MKEAKESAIGIMICVDAAGPRMELLGKPTASDVTAMMIDAIVELPRVLEKTHGIPRAETIRKVRKIQDLFWKETI